MAPHASTDNPVEPAPPLAAAGFAEALIHRRQTILPKRLVAPGPDAAQTRALFDAAAQAPDHHQLLPWRFILVPLAARPQLAEAFAAALLTRDAAATPEQLAQAREKAFRAPWLALAVARLRDGDADVPPQERIVSAGCALQNLLLMAQAQGFGAALTSGKALASAPLRALFGLGPDEQALCFVSVGSVARARPARERPAPERFVSTLGQGDGVWPRAPLA